MYRFSFKITSHHKVPDSVVIELDVPSVLVTVLVWW